MTHHVFTRELLHDRVWAEPMRTVALSLGVSDVGLAKVCRAANIPVPPRGYWAKLQHGKPVPTRPPLPPRPNRQDRVVIAPPTPRPPPPPEVQTAIDTALAEIAEVPVPDDLRRAHPIVRGWLDRNAEQRREWRRMGWGVSGIEDLTTPHPQAPASDQRPPQGARGAGAGAGGGSGVAHRRVRRGPGGISAVWPQQGVHRPATADELRWHPDRKVRATEPPGDLVLKVRDWLSIPTEYKELKASLESQLPVIVANLEAGVPNRRSVVRSGRWSESVGRRPKRSARNRPPIARPNRAWWSG